MAEELIISVSGLRGIVGENLDENIALDYGCAFGTFLKNRSSDKNSLSVCIGRDSRPSGEILASAVTQGLCQVGIDVIDLGIVPTPSVGVMLRQMQCCGGVVVTASHNPGQYNGIKLLLDNGVAPPPKCAQQIKDSFLNKNFKPAKPADFGRVTSESLTDDIHITKVLSLVDKEAIAAKKFKVVLDSVNGAGGPITKKLLNQLGCSVTAINDEPTGLFAHTPEPVTENLVEICEAVKDNNAQIGFAQDPDADRLAIVDENGNYIGEEYTLAFAAKYIFSKQKGIAAANLSTSRMIDDIAKKAGGSVIRTAVGEANVAAAMLENNCIIGGEGNGGVIDLRVGPIRDSLIGIVLVLALMTETEKSVSQLAAEVGSYYMSKKKFAADKKQAEKIIKIAKNFFADAKLDTTDGCRFDFDDGWVHLRTSNTEPVMRIIVEAKDKQSAEKYINTIETIR